MIHRVMNETRVLAIDLTSHKYYRAIDETVGHSKRMMRADLTRGLLLQEINMEMLVELDRLIQLLESPIFTCE